MKVKKDYSGLVRKLKIGALMGVAFGAGTLNGMITFDVTKKHIRSVPKTEVATMYDNQSPNRKPMVLQKVRDYGIDLRVPIGLNKHLATFRGSSGASDISMGHDLFFIGLLTDNKGTVMGVGSDGIGKYEWKQGIGGNYYYH